jgi:hypothetical protein
MHARHSAPLSVAGLLLFLSACAGSPAPAAAPAPPPAAQPAPAPTPVPAPTPAPEPQPLVYGVDLDTVHAGRFDQGKMWTFDAPPADYFAQTYGFTADAAWFEHARLGALRLANCSASFVSPNGLVMTNHHCAREFLTQVSRDGESLLDNGFVAKDLADERVIEDFRADQLVEIVDVTDEVNGVLDPLPRERRSAARDSVSNAIEARILAEHGGEGSGFVVEMVSLYNGGRTSAYVFRRFENARLVAAPELQIGYFGGDPDNFTYPRYALDFSFLRIYDDQGRPFRSDTYFKFDDDGLAEGEAVFVIGNPGSTSRLQTTAELEYRRDIGDRATIDFFRSRMDAIQEFIDAHPDEAEELDLRNQYFSLSNSLKAVSGQLRGLEDPVIIARRRDTDRQFQAAIEARPELAGRYGGLIARMAELQDRKRELESGVRGFLAFGNTDFGSTSIFRAFFVFQVLSARQGGAPPEAIEGLMDQLRSIPDQPADLDRVFIEARLRDLIRGYGEGSQVANGVLGGMSVEARAQQVVSQSQLQDSATAVAAVENGTVTLADPALAIVRGFLPGFIQYQNIFEVLDEESEISADLGRARFEIYGTSVPPDATFSLRISDGVVTGYDYNGTRAPIQTTLYGLYDRHYSHVGEADWALPDSWLNAPATLDLSTPMDFVSTADIIGGNSGSPVVDADLEVVGLAFDGNIESLPGDYIYLPESNRMISTDVRGILEALDEVYDLDRVVLELRTGRLVATEQEADRAGR